MIPKKFMEHACYTIKTAVFHGLVAAVLGVTPEQGRGGGTLFWGCDPWKRYKQFIQFQGLIAAVLGVTPGKGRGGGTLFWGCDQ